MSLGLPQNRLCSRAASDSGNDSSTKPSPAPTGLNFTLDPKGTALLRPSVCTPLVLKGTELENVHVSKPRSPARLEPMSLYILRVSVIVYCRKYLIYEANTCSHIATLSYLNKAVSTKVDDFIQYLYLTLYLYSIRGLENTPFCSL